MDSMLTPYDQLLIEFAQVQPDIDISSHFNTTEERNQWIHRMIDGSLSTIQLIGKNENERVEINAESPARAVGHTVLQMLLSESMPLKEDIGVQDPILRSIAAFWYNALLNRAVLHLDSFNGDKSQVLSFFKANVKDASKEAFPKYIGNKVNESLFAFYAMVERDPEWSQPILFPIC